MGTWIKDLTVAKVTSNGHEDPLYAASDDELLAIIAYLINNWWGLDIKIEFIEMDEEEYDELIEDQSLEGESPEGESIDPPEGFGGNPPPGHRSLED